MHEPKTFNQRMREDTRLRILTILHGIPGGALNSSRLHAGLQAFDRYILREQLLDELQWLADNRLVRMTSIEEGIYNCQITDAGDETAEGIRHVPGVRRPPRPA